MINTLTTSNCSSLRLRVWASAFPLTHSTCCLACQLDPFLLKKFFPCRAKLCCQNQQLWQIKNIGEGSPFNQEHNSKCFLLLYCKYKPFFSLGWQSLRERKEERERETTKKALILDHCWGLVSRPNTHFTVRQQFSLLEIHQDHPRGSTKLFSYGVDGPICGQRSLKQIELSEISCPNLVKITEVIKLTFLTSMLPFHVHALQERLCEESSPFQKW